MAEVIQLDTSFKLESGQEVTEITITDTMKQVGALRGLKLYDVMTSDVDSLIKLLPRVTSPRLSERDVLQLPIPSFNALATGIANFLVPSSPPEMTDNADE
ncbi:phage tail assembly protein [Providencia sp. wls1922]|uniref:phage tail assembly protein n=1 Tax=Providencia sp. wls1922 TaxID=2675152 RepID=UPI0012B55D96|nr:phage tail assembly protein [Providencia sp. wls1922]MTC46786.1 phage tail assembly protein [Providencia sp. wls1922]MTC47473.1 phage tail assembly protein [Providencia sp. wls1922]